MHTKTNDEEMFLIIEEWQRSKVSQKQYCREHDIAYHIFHYWYRKYRDRQTTSTASGFVEIKRVPAGPFAEFSFPGGSRVIFHQPVSIEYLKGLAG
jgi:transposase-like protein